MNRSQLVRKVGAGREEESRLKDRAMKERDWAKSAREFLCSWWRERRWGGRGRERKED